jgi:hypothetical protein
LIHFPSIPKAQFFICFSIVEREIILVSNATHFRKESVLCLNLTHSVVHVEVAFREISKN